MAAVADVTVSAFQLAVVAQTTLFTHRQPGSNMVLSGDLGVPESTEFHHRLRYLIASVTLLVCYSVVLAPADEIAEAHSLSALSMKSPGYT